MEWDGEWRHECYQVMRHVSANIRAEGMMFMRNYMGDRVIHRCMYATTRVEKQKLQTRDRRCQ